MDQLAKIVLALLLPASAAAQQWIGAHGGMINHAEGVLYLDQERLQFPAARFREIAKGKSLRTGKGWVEVQLGSNAFLWMGEEGVLRMEDPSLTNTQLVVERGSVLIQIYEQTKTNKITIRFRESIIELANEGFYRLDSGKSQLSVYNGKVKIQQAGNMATVKRGKAAILNDRLAVSKFDTKHLDQLDAYAAQRWQLLSKAILEARRKELEEKHKEDKAREALAQRQQQEQMIRLQSDQNQYNINVGQQQNLPAAGAQEGHPSPYDSQGRPTQPPQ